MITIMVLTTNVVGIVPEDISQEWIETWSRTANLVLALMPFAGIAFLWFTGVVRDWLGDREDQFFSTLFFGSAIIQVALWFLSGAVFRALLSTRVLVGVGLAGDGALIFGAALVSSVIGDYVLRMAGVYMTAIATLGTKTGTMPRWLTIVTYVLALGFVVSAPMLREARFVFPAWVLVVSIYILILNYRRTHDREDENGPSLND
jgi:hypothetical protein